MSTLLITHDLGLAGEYCDRIAVMHAGHIVEIAPTEALLATPRHPYTRAAARRHAGAGTRLDDLDSIPGQSARSAPRRLPPCRFSGRCERRQPICDEAQLPWTELSRRACRALPVSAVMSAAARSQVAGQILSRSSGRRGAVLHAVDDVDLTIGAGESVGLVGESGCGKSTMVRLLGRLIDPTAGQILLGGEDLTAMAQAKFASLGEPAAHPGGVPGPDRKPEPSFRVFQAIADPLQRLLGMNNGAEMDSARSRHRRRWSGCREELLQRYPHQLSGGQKRACGHRARRSRSSPRC